MKIRAGDILEINLKSGGFCRAIIGEYGMVDIWCMPDFDLFEPVAVTTDEIEARAIPIQTNSW